MHLRFLGRGGSDVGECPSLYATDEGSFIVQGWVTENSGTVEIPHLLTGFAEPDTFIGVTMTDTGRGTFVLTGRPVTDHETLARLDLACGEAAIEVPMRERTYYGAISAA